ncbi:MAG: NAD-dependent epimerase/dehydratase family protein [Terriglobia bacterium]
MRILVTGAGGFIGSHVVRLLVKEGHSVWATISPGGSAERISDILGQISLCRVDLRERGAVRDLLFKARPECAIHMAWYAAPGKYWTAPENLDCVKMSLDLVQELAAVGCHRLVAAGSCAEYDWDYGFLSEESTPLRPRTLYGVCKNATREILQGYCRQVSINFAWTRFFYLYGPCEAKERLVPSVILSLLRGETAKCTEGEQMRDFLHVEDVASAVWAVTKSDLIGPVNIGSGQPVKIRTVIETLARSVPGSKNVVFGALPMDPAEPPLLVADVRKLKTHAGSIPPRNLEDGLRQSIAWWRENSNLSERSA